MNREDAKDMLYQMVKVPGLLRIITNECAVSGCEGDRHNESEYTLVDPRHFVIHKVTKLEQLHNGQMRAHSAEGDWCQGQAEDLLPRLQERNLGSRPARQIIKVKKGNILTRLLRR